MALGRGRHRLRAALVGAAALAAARAAARPLAALRGRRPVRLERSERGEGREELARVHAQHLPRDRRDAGEMRGEMRESMQARGALGCTRRTWAARSTAASSSCVSGGASCAGCGSGSRAVITGSGVPARWKFMLISHGSVTACGSPGRARRHAREGRVHGRVRACTGCVPEHARACR